MAGKYVLCVKDLDVGEAHFDEGSMYFKQDGNIYTYLEDAEYSVTPPGKEAFQEYFAEVEEDVRHS